MLYEIVLFRPAATMVLTLVQEWLMDLPTQKITAQEQLVQS